MADESAFAAALDRLAGSTHEGADRIAAGKHALPVELELTIGCKQRAEVVEPPTVAAMRVRRHQLANGIAGGHLPGRAHVAGAPSARSTASDEKSFTRTPAERSCATANVTCSGVRSRTRRSTALPGP